MNSLIRKTSLVAVVLAAMSLSTTAATAQCSIDGVITAAPNTTDPALGVWEYTLTIVWNNDGSHGLSHFNLFMDEVDANCSCSELSDALHLVTPAGTSDGEPSACTVTYDSFFECSGDPSIGLVGTILKFEPVEDGCEPGPVGSGTFVFYSNYPPAPVSLPGLYMSDKFSTYSCQGTLTGVFPGLPCDPVGNAADTWGGVKQTYR